MESFHSLPADTTAKLLATALHHALMSGWRFVRDRSLSADGKQSSDLAWEESQRVVADSAASTGALLAKSLPELAGFELKALEALLQSPELEAITRQVVAIVLTNKNPDASLQSVRQRVELLSSTHPGLGPLARAKLTDLLFPALRGAIQRALRPTPRLQLYSEAAQKAARENRFLRDESEQASYALDTLKRLDSQSVADILRFERDYRREVGQRHAFLSPPHHSESPKVPLSELYVAPRFSKVVGGSTAALGALSVKALLAEMYRAVILGQPGGGKSSFAGSLCNSLSTDYESRRFGGRSITPILVVLRDYATANATRNASIVDYITSQSAATYQQAPPTHAFDYLLTSGRALVVFDGLDELPETHARRKIADDVESFCRSYPGVPIIVTSREVGYEQAPLDPRMFDTFRIAPFNEDQVEKYVRNWFALEIVRHTTPEARHADSFLAESREVDDLRENPLMLALMCSLYRDEGYIPQNRPDVYRKCAEMLFERWDARRGLPVHFRYESLLRPAIAHLAHWIYRTPDLSHGVTEAALVEQAAKYLHRNRYEHIEDARQAAADFITFCQGRAWVFTDTGKNAKSEDLYQFTHRTFLEYFTALDIARGQETSEGLASHLLPRVLHREWDVVAQLAIQIKASETEGGADRIFAKLLDVARNASAVDRWNVLAFLARSMSFVTPSIEMVGRLTNASLDLALDLPVQAKPKKGADLAEQVVERQHEPLAILLSTPGDFRSVVERTITEKLLGHLRDVEFPAKRLAVQYATYLDLLVVLGQGQRNVPASELVEWQRVSAQIVAEAETSLRAIASGDVEVAVCLFHRGYIAALEIVRSLGVGALMSGAEIAFAGHKPLECPARTLISAALSTEGGLFANEELASLAPFFEAQPAPFFDFVPIDIGFLRSTKPPANNAGRNDGAAAFTVFVLSAAVVEQEPFSIEREVTSSLPFGAWLRARVAKEPSYPDVSELVPYELSANQAAVVDAWARHRLTFVRAQS